MDSMASLPAVTSDAIALTEKKMFMSLDDIIKMSKKMTRKANKKLKASANKRRRGFINLNGVKPAVRKPLMSRAGCLGQDKPDGVRSRIRSNRGNQLSAVKAAARRAALAPVRTRVGQWNKKRNVPLMIPRSGLSRAVYSNKVNGALKQAPGRLDSLFASMKVERMRVQAHTGTGTQKRRIFENKINLGGSDFRGRRRTFNSGENRAKLVSNGFRERQRAFQGHENQAMLVNNDFRERQRAFEGHENQAMLVNNDFRERQRAFQGRENHINSVWEKDFRERQMTFSGHKNLSSFGMRRNYY